MAPGRGGGRFGAGCRGLADAVLVGVPVWMELSFALDHLAPERVRRILLAHPADRLLFGTDSPWTDQAASLERLRQLRLPAELLTRITGANGRRLLGA